MGHNGAVAKPKANPGPDEVPPPLPKLVVRRERKGHGGKGVTIVEGVPAARQQELAATLKRRLGTGARVEGDAVIVQGEQVERVEALLEAAGAARVVRGN